MIHIQTKPKTHIFYDLTDKISEEMHLKNKYYIIIKIKYKNLMK
jgi:hypothetical protein